MAEIKKIEVRASFIAHAAKLLEKVTPDMIDTDVAKPYEEALPDSGIVDCLTATKYASECLKAMSVCKLYSKVCQAMFLAARKETQRQEALAFFAAETELKKGEAKVTDTLKKSFVDMAEGVQKAKDIRNSWETLKDYFEAGLFEFKLRHEWYREIFKKDMSTGDMQEKG
jgi:hypothetical protein